MTNTDRRTPYEHDATNVDLIVHGRTVHPARATCNCTRQLADALEAAEAQVAYLNARNEMDGGPSCIACPKDRPEGPHSRHNGHPCTYHDGTCEEAEANPSLKCQCGRFVPMAGGAWPADLLEAVRELSREAPDNAFSRVARATLIRYGLLPEEAR